MIYFHAKRCSSSRTQDDAVSNRINDLSGVIVDSTGVIAGTVAVDLNHKGADWCAVAADMLHDGLETCDRYEGPVVYFEAFEQAKQADAFKFFAAGVRLMQSCKIPSATLKANDRIQELYRQSGASVPMIDAAMDAEATDYTGVLETSQVQYQQVLALAGMSGDEMELLIANANISI